MRRARTSYDRIRGFEHLFSRFLPMQPTTLEYEVTDAGELLAHGVPHAARNPSDPEAVLIDGRTMRFSDAVADVLLGLDGRQPVSS